MLLVALSAVAAAEEEKIRLGEFIPASPPQPAPEVRFTDPAGKPMTLGDFAGKPTVVNLWATWCQPCLKEMPSLDRLQADLGGKLNVAAISEDRAGGSLVNPFFAAMKLGNLKVYLDPKGDVGHAFGARGLPTSIVLNAKGRVMGKVEGPADWDGPQMKAVIAPLLKGGEAPTRALNEAR